MKYRELPKRILREKPQRKIRLIHLQSSHRNSLNSTTLFLSIVKSLRAILPKPFSHHTHICEKAVWFFGKQLRRDQFLISRCYGQVAESGKLKKKLVRRNLVGVGTWRVQLHQVDQAWRVFCCSCIPTTFNGLFTVWRAAKRFFAEFFGFLFDNTSPCNLVVASLFSYSCALLLFFVIHVYALEQLSVYYTSFTLVPHLDKLK